MKFGDNKGVGVVSQSIILWGEVVVMEVVTVLDVIQKRSQELFEEYQTLSEELKNLEKRREEILRRQAEIEIEQEILSSNRDTRSYKILHSKENEGLLRKKPEERMRVTDRMDFETSLRAIFSKANYRALKMIEIINELGNLGFKWSSYSTAYQYITNCDLLENTSRGYYTLRRL